MLNYRPHRLDIAPNCTLCNLRIPEDTYHFLGVCPTLKEIRRFYFCKDNLDTQEVIDILNGRDWIKLVNYVTEASNYRMKIVNELF